MKKGIIAGICVGVLAAILITVLYFVVVVKHSNEVVPPMSTEAYVPQETTVASTEPATEEESSEEESSEEEEESTTEEDVRTFVLDYGDTSESLVIPQDSCTSYEAFMSTEGVLEMLGTLLFDLEVEWVPESFEFDGAVLTMRGNAVVEDGYVIYRADMAKGDCALESHIYQPTVQTKEDFRRPGTSPETNYGPGTLLADINAKTVSTVVVNVNDIVDWDTTAGTYVIPDTLRVITKDMSTQDDMIDTYLRYVHHYFGDGDIVIWDYEKPQANIFVIYASINGWNVAAQLRGGDPFGVRATALPTADDFNPYQ